MKKKVVVIGATGNTGAYLVDDLVNKLPGDEYEVFAAGHRSTGFFDRYGIGYASVDMSEASSLDELPREGRLRRSSPRGAIAGIHERL